VYSRVTTSSNALRLPVYLRRCQVSLTIDGRNDIDEPSSCLSSRRGTVDVIENSVSTRDLWNNGHELNLCGGEGSCISSPCGSIAEAQAMLKRLTF
jgi:hypothetical protein